MNTFLPAIVALPASLLLACLFIPLWLANKYAGPMRTYVTFLTAVQAVLTFGLAVAYGLGFVPAFEFQLSQWASDGPANLIVYYDGVTSLMLALVSFVGWIVCSFSVRYLDGDPLQGRYFRWTAFTIGAVSAMVFSGNLVMFLAAWVMTSLGLHQLLLHFSDRPAARRAAWTKFTISRLGDAALLGAVAILYSELGTLDFGQLFATVGSYSFIPTPEIGVAGFLIVCGGLTKSAQLPFHTWLPLTMETPTPVSALMHAGIVNAGGYLMIRLSPLVSLTPWSMTFMAIVGAITALFAAVVMLTQTNVKTALAYSTIAQMGFMMLQCGLGAFSIAMLHIVAHSMYKAHAFLSSGSVVAERAATRGLLPMQDAIPWPKLVLAGVANVAFLAIALAAFQINPTLKPGGVLLGFVLCLGLTSWLSQVLRSGSRPIVMRAIAACAGLCLLYAASFWGIDRIVADSLPKTATPMSMWLISAIVATGFSGMFILQITRTRSQQPKWLRAWWVHASNGFYFDAWLRRTLGHLA